MRLLVAALTFLFGALVYSPALAVDSALSNSDQSRPPRSHQELEALFNSPDLWGAYSHFRPAIDALSPAERNDFALIAAKNLSLGELGKNITAADWNSDFLNLPQNAKIRLRWAENMHAADAVSYASEKRYITDKRIIPFLIDALDHPDQSFVRSDAFHALTSLTRHRTGEQALSNSPSDAQMEEITTWWRTWWKKNENKHPIFDLELEAQAKKEWLRVATIIEDSVAKDFPVLSAYHVRNRDDLVFGEASPLYDLQYEPCLLSNMWWGQGHKPDDNLWLDVSVDLGTPDASNPKLVWERPQPKPSLVKLPVSTVYEKKIEGSDVIIRLRVATTDKSLTRALKKALK